MSPPDRPAHAECFRSDRRGAWHPSAARQVLAEHGHPDVELVHVSGAASPGLFH